MKVLSFPVNLERLYCTGNRGSELLRSL